MGRKGSCDAHFLGTFRYICLVRLSTSLQTYWCQSAYNTDTPNFPRALSFHAAWGNFRIPLGGYKDTHTHWALFRSLSPFRGPPNPSLNILEIHKSGRLLVQSAHLYGKLVPAGCPCSRQTYTGKFVPAALNTRHVRKYHEFPEFVHGGPYRGPSRERGKRAGHRRPKNTPV